jgi:nucleoside-diphosphate-sugar epimerase
MIIGKGMVATGFKTYETNDDFIIFASGVSNSKTINAADYTREFSLLRENIEKYKDKTLVYFSTCSIYDPGEINSAYILHKLKTEEFIRQNTSSFYIFRVSNLVGKSTNQNTVLNFFYFHMKNKINFDLWDNSTRNLIDIDDMFRIVDYILQRKLFCNQIINVANPKSYKVKDIISALETTLGLKANYISIAKGSNFSIDISLIAPIIRQLNLQFGENYLNRLIKKYYTGNDLQNSRI